MTRRFPIRTMVLAACLAICGHAGEWPTSPATNASDPAPDDTAWELCTFRHVRPVLEAIHAAAGSDELNKPLQVVFWDPTLAQQLNNKTTHGARLLRVQETKDGLLIEASLGEVADRDLNLQIPVSFQLRLDEAKRAEALAALRDRLLSVTLSARAVSVSHGDNGHLIVTTKYTVATLRRNGTAITDALPTKLQTHVPTGHHQAVAATAETAVSSERVIEGEDFEGIRLFSDWEPTETGWYARTIKEANRTLTYSEDSVAVAHEVAIGKPLIKTLATPLPPGRYEVLLDVSYHRTRLDDNIMAIALGDQTHHFSWFLPPTYFGVGEEKGLIRGPVFTLTEPTSTISLTPVQLGGGGLNEIPTFQKRFIMIDRVLIRGL